jgi:hypothetical protein
MSCIGNSAAKRAWPRTLSGPSSRETGAPIRPRSRAISGSGLPPGIHASGATAMAFFMTA